MDNHCIALLVNQGVDLIRAYTSITTPIRYGSVAQSDWLSEYRRDAELESLNCPFEVWEIQGSNASMGYATHAIFRYFGKFPPPVARRFITDFHDPSIGPVIDTMVGSGTTLVEAAILGRKAIGFDINPLSVLISNVKINVL